MTSVRAVRRGVRALAVPVVLVVALAGCGGQDAPSPTSTAPASAAPATEPAEPQPTVEPEPTVEPAPTDEPTTGPTDEPTTGPTAAPVPTPRPSATGGPASACTGSAENRAFYAAVAEDVAWDVYCPVLPAGWFVDAGNFWLAGGGRLEIAYRGPAGARLEIRQGAYCRGDDDCIPAGPDAGTASFGDRPARLFDIGDGRWLVVAEGGDVNWEVRSSGLSRATAVGVAADFARVGR